MTSTLIAFVLSIASPLLLWPIELLLPWPHIVEEMAKAFIVLVLANDSESDSTTIIKPIITGFLFTISETMFYLLNFLKLGNFSNIFKRLLFTGTLHITTTILMYLGIKKGQHYFLASFLLSVIIHYVFNSSIIA